MAVVVTVKSVEFEQDWVRSFFNAGLSQNGKKGLVSTPTHKYGVIRCFRKYLVDREPPENLLFDVFSTFH